MFIVVVVVGGGVFLSIYYGCSLDFVHVLVCCYCNTFWVVVGFVRGKAVNAVSNGSSSL